MIQRLKKIKTSIVIGMLLTCFIITFSTPCNAKLLSVSTDVKMTYNAKTASDKILPLSGEITIPINISAKIRGLLASFFERIFKDRTDFTIDLSVKETPKWCTARISPNVVNTKISSEWQSEEAYIHVSFTELAPAHVPSIVTIEMNASAKGTLGYVKGVTNTAEISFTPSYLPIFDVIPRDTSTEINPGEKAIFYIDLENLANADTEFVFEVTKKPKKWNVSIPSSVVIGSRVMGDNSEKTIQMSVRPPNNFKKYNKSENISIEVYGQYFASTTGQELRSDLYELTFTVKLNSSTEETSIIELEPIIIILLIIIIALIAIIFIMTLFIKKHYL